MAKGLSFVISTGGSAFAAVQSKSMSWSAEGIDTTNDDDGGYRSFDDASGTESIDMSVEGVALSDEILDIALGGGPRKMELTLTFPSSATVVGTFLLGSVEISAGDSNDTVKFSASLASDGAWVYTAAV